MSTHVLILATRYDKASDATYKWAEQLRDDLILKSKVETCLLLDGEGLCHSGTSLSDAIDRVDFVVFYGHGDDDQWISIPAGSAASAISLVDVNTVTVFNGRHVYAACCKSRSQLGSAYKSQHSAPDFIGYATDFNFSEPNQDEFRRIVHDSIRTFVLGGKAAATIVADQRVAWSNLANDFRSGRFSTYPDAIFSASCADANANSIGLA